MKYSILALTVLLGMPSAAFAQEGPPQGGGMMQMRQQARSSMLGALTPEHKTLLASVAGQLATAATPDVNAAARQLDAALSPSEKQAILSGHQAMVSQMQSMWGNGNGQGPPGGGMRAMGGMASSNDPGMILIVTAMRLPAGGPPGGGGP